jgi:hypothetical protein
LPTILVVGVNSVITKSKRKMASKSERLILSKQGDPIEEGDHVYTKIRGGRHEGDVSILERAVFTPADIATQVEKIVSTSEAAEEEAVKNPPKVSKLLLLSR